MLGKDLVCTGAVTTAAAIIGSIASANPDGRWYRSLRKPSIQPPPVVFPIVWTALYADIAVSSAVALTAAERRAADTGADAEVHAYRWALLTNLALNASWPWTAFAAHRLGLSTVHAAALAASSVDLVRRTARLDRRAGLALTPYAIWCGFATVLSAALALKNPRS